jgi:hypothetical protein
MNSLIAYTQNHTIHIPDIEVKTDIATHRYAALRGYAYVLAVFDLRGVCIGWILSETLGFENVARWLLANKSSKQESTTIH